MRDAVLGHRGLGGIPRRNPVMLCWCSPECKDWRRMCVCIPERPLMLVCVLDIVRVNDCCRLEHTGQLGVSFVAPFRWTGIGVSRGQAYRGAGLVRSNALVVVFLGTYIDL
jgi:hypothetical protein